MTNFNTEKFPSFAKYKVSEPGYVGSIRFKATGNPHSIHSNTWEILTRHDTKKLKMSIGLQYPDWVDVHFHLDVNNPVEFTEVTKIIENYLAGGVRFKFKSSDGHLPVNLKSKPTIVKYNKPEKVYLHQDKTITAYVPWNGKIKFKIPDSDTNTSEAGLIYYDIGEFASKVRQNSKLSIDFGNINLLNNEHIFIVDDVRKTYRLRVSDNNSIAIYSNGKSIMFHFKGEPSDLIKSNKHIKDIVDYIASHNEPIKDDQHPFIQLCFQIDSPNTGESYTTRVVIRGKKVDHFSVNVNSDCWEDFLLL